MPILPQSVNNPMAGDHGVTIPGLTEETVNIAGSMISSITDLDLNVFIGDERDIYFGYHTDFSIGISDDQQSLEFKNNLTNHSLLELKKDKTLYIGEADYNEMHNFMGNVALTARGMYIRN